MTPVEEEVYEDDGKDDEPEDPDQAASSADSPPSPSDPDADALALAHPPVADDPLTGAELMLDLARQHWRSLLLTVLVTVLASLLKMTSMRHMSRLYDLIKPAGRAGAAGAPGVPLRPLLELAALRVAPARRSELHNATQCHTDSTVRGGWLCNLERDVGPGGGLGAVRGLSEDCAP